MNKTELEGLLPHRPPMLLLDEAEVVECPDGLEAHGRITITGDEFFVQGHFPGNPVVPGVIQCEMLAQNCCVLLADDPAAKGATPCDTVELVCRLTRARGPFRFAEGTASVDGKVCCKAEMSFALMPAGKEA